MKFSIPNIPDEVIGLWRFREVGKPRMWAATFAVNGHYYDTLGHRTPEKCVMMVTRKLKLLERKAKNV